MFLFRAMTTRRLPRRSALGNTAKPGVRSTAAHCRGFQRAADIRDGAGDRPAELRGAGPGPDPQRSAFPERVAPTPGHGIVPGVPLGDGDAGRGLDDVGILGRSWEKAQALIVETRPQHTAGGRLDTFVHEFVAEVTTAEGEVFRTKLEDPYFSPDFLEPELRDVVGVEFDPKSRRVRFDRSDPGLSIRAQRHARQDRFDRALQEAPSTGTGTPAGAASERLALLNELRRLQEQGVISQDEFREQARAVLLLQGPAGPDQGDGGG